mmetsp:Transcript_18960/g.52902  ORF Transcript_18960/g.52902 Transcript_18960/m.52902 type:complete len:255 (-) Transcript_18960:312-1076(-)
MKFQRRKITKGTGESGSNGGVLPLHLNDGLDHWGCQDKEESDSNSSDSESDTDTDSDAATYVTKPAPQIKEVDPYTAFVLELERSITFGKSSAGQRQFRTERDSEQDSFLDGYTIVIDENDSRKGRKDDDERTATTLLGDGFSVVALDSDDSSDDESSSSDDDSSCENPRNCKRGSSYFWRRRRYVMTRRLILMLLAMIMFLSLLLLALKLASGIRDSITLSYRNHIDSSVANGIYEKVELTTIWDVDSNNMGV